MKFIVSALFLLFLSTPSFAASGKTPVLVELYTSQSCSSCPRADALFEKLAQNPDIITLGCHVTYWDHLRWKDSYSLEDCTKRQQDFGQNLEHGRVYTPEAIINGRSGVVGYREDLIMSAVRKQIQDAKTVPLAIMETKDGYEISFPELPAGRQVSYIVTLLAYGDTAKVKIGAGENDGENVTYAKPVIAVKDLNYWQGKSESRKISFSDIPENTRGFVVSAQMVHGGPIIAAGEFKK